MITSKEMVRISKELEVKEKLKKENEELRTYTKAIEKKLQEAKKVEKTKHGMEETIKHLQKMVD